MSAKPQDGTLMRTPVVPSGNESAVLSLQKAAGVSPDRALGGPKSMEAYDTDGDSSTDTECPTCGRDDFADRHAMKLHHSHAHGESIAGVELVCEQCSGSYRCPPNEADESRFCSYNCKNEWQSENLSGKNSPHWKGEKTELICDQCGDSYRDKQNRIERSRFCSNECKWASMSDTTGEDNPNWKGGKSTYICDWCDSEFKEWPSQSHKLCSEKCQFEKLAKINQAGKTHPSWNGGEARLICEQCGARYTTKRVYKDTSRFCSYTCNGKWKAENLFGKNHWRWEGGPANYGAGWHRRKREIVRERDGRQCRICGVSELEHRANHGEKHTVHHIVKARDVDDADIRNGPHNLVTICRDHHSDIEKVSPLVQFRMFLPHPPLPTEQATLKTFANRGGG